MSAQESQTLHWHFTTDIDDNDFKIHGRLLFFIIILFGIVALTTFLILYARWVRLYQRHYFWSNQPPNVPHAPPPQLLGLHPTIIKALPITLHQSSSSSSSSECCICLGVFEDGDKVKVLPVCSHIFHSECLDRWLAARSSCPLCRASIHSGGSAVVISVLTE